MYKNQLKTRNFSFGIFALNSAANQPRSLQKRKRHGERRAQCWVLWTLHPTADDWDPRKRLPWWADSFSGRGAQGNFSLLPVNLRPGGRHSIQKKLSIAASLVTASGQLLPGDTLPFLETLPFLLWMKNGGEQEIRKGALHWSEFHQCSALIWNYFRVDFFLSPLLPWHLTLPFFTWDND